ncbi:MAG: 3-hydroxybutyrate oligomer hydrolase family protein [Luteimonas sp.]
MPAIACEAFRHIRSRQHCGADDLLTAGLGLEGLRACEPPVFADAEAPTGTELRRRAIWSNWRGIADLMPEGGYGTLYGSTADIPGREFSTFAHLPGASQPHRVLAQIPDAFDQAKRCLVVTASSGSRGVYGAIAVAGAWGLPKGFAVAYTDKGTGSDYFDLDSRSGVRIDGTRGDAEEALAFAPTGSEGMSGIAFKHAHSQDNPEADWGRHVRQAAQFALRSLDEAFPDATPFTFANTRVIAVGISNGGGAVLRAAELDDGQSGEPWLDAVVAGEPSIYAQAEGARAIYDYATEAALLMPCALLHMHDLPQPPMTAQIAPMWTQRCASLRSIGMVEGEDASAQAHSAYDTLLKNGWKYAALRGGALSTGFDLWRAVAVTYASAYGRYGIGEHPAGYAFATQSTDGTRRATTAAERAAWWSDASGIPPGAGVNIVDPHSSTHPSDSAFAGLLRLRELWAGASVAGQRVRNGIEATRAGLPRNDLPVLVVHGIDDGLVPMAFSSAPYVACAKAAGREVRFWQIRNAQHFDAFLAWPEYRARYVPLLPYIYAALDRIAAHLDHHTALPADAIVDAKPCGIGFALAADNLAVP